MPLQRCRRIGGQQVRGEFTGVDDAVSPVLLRGVKRPVGGGDQAGHVVFSGDQGRDSGPGELTAAFSVIWRNIPGPRAAAEAGLG
jgi:hypothetical protein